MQQITGVLGLVFAVPCLAFALLAPDWKSRAELAGLGVACLVVGGLFLGAAIFA